MAFRARIPFYSNLAWTTETIMLVICKKHIFEFRTSIFWNCQKPPSFKSFALQKPKDPRLNFSMQYKFDKRRRNLFWVFCRKKNFESFCSILENRILVNRKWELENVSMFSKKITQKNSQKMKISNFFWFFWLIYAFWVFLSNVVLFVHLKVP
jgi:hypothetical protein